MFGPVKSKAPPVFSAQPLPTKRTEFLIGSLADGVKGKKKVVSRGGFRGVEKIAPLTSDHIHMDMCGELINLIGPLVRLNSPARSVMYWDKLPCGSYCRYQTDPEDNNTVWFHWGKKKPSSRSDKPTVIRCKGSEVLVQTVESSAGLQIFLRDQVPFISPELPAPPVVGRTSQLSFEYQFLSLVNMLRTVADYFATLETKRLYRICAAINKEEAKNLGIPVTETGSKDDFWDTVFKASSESGVAVFNAKSRFKMAPGFEFQNRNTACIGRAGKMSIFTSNEVPVNQLLLVKDIDPSCGGMPYRLDWVNLPAEPPHGSFLMYNESGMAIPYCEHEKIRIIRFK